MRGRVADRAGRPRGPDPGAPPPVFEPLRGVWVKRHSRRPAVEARMAALAAATGAAPRLLHFDAGEDTLVFERLPGVTLDSLLRDLAGSREQRTPAEGLRRSPACSSRHRQRRLPIAFLELVGALLGQALRSVHRLSLPPGEPSAQQPSQLAAVSVGAFGELGEGAVSLLESWHRDAGLVDALARLGGPSRSARSRTSLVHGDLTADNVIVSFRDHDQPSVAIVDWELAGAGDPAWDVACVEADLVSRWLCTARPRPGRPAAEWLGGNEPLRAFALRAIEAFRSGYGAPDRDERASRLLGAALLMRALALADAGDERERVLARLVALVGKRLICAPREAARLFSKSRNGCEGALAAALPPIPVNDR